MIGVHIEERLNCTAFNLLFDRSYVLSSLMEKQRKIETILFDGFGNEFDDEICLDSRIECKNLSKFLSILHSLRILKSSFIATMTHFFNDDLIIVSLILFIEGKLHSLVRCQDFQSIIQF